jgi:site-specific DNA recombinase
MKRAAIYARYSSDLQADRSVDDQIALCQEVCERNGFTVVAVFDDRGISGSSVVNRPGFQSLMQAAQVHAFDVVVAEDIDRISRDQADYHTARKRLEFLGIAIHSAHGAVNRIDGSLRALMSELFIENLAGHVRRGMQGVIREGRHAGGKAYGYRTTGARGVLEIDPMQAAIVRRIFEDYLSGDTPREIAVALNRDGASPPRGAVWNASTINGSAQRANGILHNELYAGCLIWNRVRMVKDPATGKRISRPNPKAEWRRADAEHLRIISDQHFTAAQLRRQTRGPNTSTGRKPKRMLSGLLRCGACGAGMSKKDMDNGRPRLVCTRAYESGACDNRRKYYLDDVERRVIAGLRQRIGTRAAVAHYIKTYNAEMHRASSARIAARSQMEARLASAQRELDRTVTALVRGAITDTEADAHLPKLRAERDRLAMELASIEEPAKVVAIHPAAVDAYLSDLERLDVLINSDLAEGDDGLARLIRNLLTTVTVMPAPAGTLPDIRIAGHLASLLADAFPQSSSTGGRVVAEERYRFSPQHTNLRYCLRSCA